MKIVVMVDKSNGNDTVGDMWTETHVFDARTTLEAVIEQIDMWTETNIRRLGNVRLQIANEH